MNSRKLKVAMIITGLGVGGAESMVLKVCQNIDRSKFEIEVISLTGNGPIGRDISKNGILVSCMNMRANPVAFALAFLQLVKHLRATRPSVVHTWMYHADLLGGIASRFANISKIIWSVRHFNLSRAQNKFSTLAIAKACAFLSPYVPNKILFNSVGALQSHQQYGYSVAKAVLIPNGFDTEKFAPDERKRKAFRQELGVRSNTLIVGMVGRFEQQKNHLGFLDLASLVLAQNSEVRFVMVGEKVDASNEELVSKISALKLKKHVHLMGLRSDIEQIMPAFDLLVSPSFGEAFSNVIGEAMSCGVPCAVTDVGDSAKIVGQTGECVPAGNIEALASAVIRILELPMKARAELGKKARRVILNNFSIDAVTKKYEELYQNTYRGDFK